MSSDLLDALSALRSAADPSARALGWAWRIIDDQLQTISPKAQPPDRDDVRQRALIKVLRSVHSLDAQTAGKARAWLKRVHRSALADHYRSLTEKELRAAVRTDVRQQTVVETLPAEDEGDYSPELLNEVLARVLERVDNWLSTHVTRPSKRAGDYRRAEVAIAANIRGQAPDEIRQKLGDLAPANDATLYKWVERGRETVLLPALAEWADPAASPIMEVLADHRRSDAGKPRGKRSVRSAGYDASTPTNGKEPDLTPAGTSGDPEV